jgi:hypothetical protein
MTNLKLSASFSTIREILSRNRISLRLCDSGEPREPFSVHDRRTSKNDIGCVLCGERQHLTETCSIQSLALNNAVVIPLSANLVIGPY